jgi:uncharacterized protein
MTPTDKPLPDVREPLTAPFWAATRESRILAPRCTNCGYVHWPPEVVCPECQQTTREWIDLPNTGHLWSYATYHRALDPAFADDLPYTVGLVELEDGVKMYGLIVGAAEEQLRIGQELRAEFDTVNEEVTFVRWRPTD